MSPIVHIDKTNKDILILGEGPTQRLDVTTLTAEAKYPINFIQQNKKFALNLLYNGSNSFLFVNATKIHHFKAKDPEMKYYWNINEILCLGNISKEFIINNMKTVD